MYKITVPQQFTSLTDVNNPFRSLMELAIIGQTTRDLQLDGSLIVNGKKHEFLTKENLLGMAQAGVKVEFVPTYLKIPSADFETQEVPVGMPNRSIVDEDGVETIFTWNKWIKPNFVPTVIDGFHYISSGAYRVDGEPLTSDYYLAASDYLIVETEMKELVIQDE